MKFLKTAYKVISLFPLLHIIVVAVFLLLYYNICPNDCPGCISTITYLDLLRTFCLYGIFVVILSAILWFPMFLELMYEVKKSWAIIYLIAHALLVLAILSDLRLNILGRILL